MGRYSKYHDKLGVEKPVFLRSKVGCEDLYYRSHRDKWIDCCVLLLTTNTFIGIFIAGMALCF